ncbi:MAG: hypothetical protein M1473_11145 [Firmicutes bacterium]|nr:hypothetical protein [Bacillota bacterium]
MLAKTSLLLATLVASSSGYSAVSCTDTQQDLLHFATTTQALHPRIASVWPKFWDETTPFIVYNLDGEAVLFTHNEPLPDYQKLSDHYYYYAERLPNITDFHFYINYPLPNDQVATAAMLGGVNSDELDARETLIHEAFHGYQRSAFADVERSQFLDPAQLNEAPTRALLTLQLALAKQAHASRELEHIHDWLIVRVALNQLLAPQVASYLGDIERIEGSAEWVGLQGTYGQDYRAQLSYLFDSLPAEVDIAAHVRRLAYATGATLISLMDEFAAPDTDWRHEMEQGKTPYELALEVFSVAPDAALEKFNHVLTQYDFSSYLTRAQASQSEAVTLADIEASHPYRLDIHVPIQINEETAGFHTHFSAGQAGFHQLSPSVIFLPEAAMFQLDIPQITADIRSAPLLFDISKFRFQVWSHTPITTLDDLNAMGELDLKFGESKIYAPINWQVESSSTDAHIHITLSPEVSD